MRKRICVDFDGVLHSYVSGWRGVACIPDRPVPGAMQWLLEATERFDVFIYSARSSHWCGRRAMRRWLTEQMTRHLYGRMTLGCNDEEHRRAIADARDDASELVHQRLHWPTRKPPAWLTIDDRCIRFDGLFPAMDEIDCFVPWYAQIRNE